MKEEQTDLRLAVLIDADNISYHHINGMMREIARYGTPTIKRIYGDWTRPNLVGWKPVLLDYAVSPVQQFGYTYGKNATDSALIIDAMDILYSNNVDGFCLVSSDSDFTRLATRLREAGKIVYGIGEQKTPNAFIAACDKFIYLEILSEGEDEHDNIPFSPMPCFRPIPELAATFNMSPSRPGARTIRQIDAQVIDLVMGSISDLADENGWAFLGDVGNLVLKKQPAFDSRNYGYQKLSQMIRSMRGLEIDERPTGQSNVRHIYIRAKSCDEGDAGDSYPSNNLADSSDD